MKIRYLLFLVVAAIMTASSFVYAAKPEQMPEKSKGKAYGQMTREEKQLAKETSKAEKNVKPITKFWFYPETEGVVEYDYENDPWGKAMVNSKKSTVRYIGHNHEPDSTYEVWYGDQKVGEGVANTDGIVNIKAAMPEGFDPSTEGFEWEVFTIKTGDATVLTSTMEHIKGMDDEEAEEIE